MADSAHRDLSTQPPPAVEAGRFLSRVPLPVRMAFYAAFFLTLMLVVVPWLASWFDVWRPAWHVEVGGLRWAGGVWLAVCLIVYLYCSWVLTRVGQGAYVEFDPPRRFVSVGPYRWMRNPVAACVVGMLLGEAVMLSSTGVLLVFLLSLPVAHLQVIVLEEPLLEKRFGRSYVEYRQCVPRWLPKRPSPSRRASP